ncbi:hypothetical protein D3C72_2136130 [compost metagenome]
MPERIGGSLDAPLIAFQVGRFEQRVQTATERQDRRALRVGKDRIVISGFATDLADKNSPQHTKRLYRPMQWHRITMLAFPMHL